MFIKDPMFWQAMRNTLWIIAVGVPLQIVTSLSLAWLLTRPKRASRYYRTMLFLPTMVPPVAAALGFVFLFNPATGPINQGLQAVGVNDPPLWFYSAFWSKWGLVFLSLWGVGQTMMIFLAGLLDVPRQLYEAAEIEGAGAWQRFRYVTLPMISPVIFFSVVIGVIAGFQYFTQAYVASFAVSGQPTGGAASNIGGPEESTLFYSLHLYIKGFAHFQMGYASAMAWILFLIIMACTIVIIRTSRRWVHYQGGFR
jgi:multiple sugar transport system permease protein